MIDDDDDGSVVYVVLSYKQHKHINTYNDPTPLKFLKSSKKSLVNVYFSCNFFLNYSIILQK